MKNKFVILMLIFICLNKVFADISISASVDKNVISLDEQVTLQVVVSGNVTNIPQPQIPKLEGFQIYSSGRSQSISIINGQVNSSVSFNYILSPTKIGEFEIPPITVTYQGKTYQTEPIKIKVEKSRTAPQQQTIPQTDVYKSKQKDIFVETFVDKKTAYVNEQITLTFRFYTRVNLLSQPQYIPPDTTGFVQETLSQNNYYTVINGQRYYVSEIKTALFPTSAGRFTISPATVKCVIEDFDIDDFFSDRFFRRFFSSGKEIVLKSQPIEVTVLELPSPQPQSFTGAVGKYTISATVDRQKVQQNETISLNIKISGIGNIKSVIIPKSYIENILGKNFVVYEPITSYSVQKENNIVKGSKTFKVPISIVVPGSLSIPEIKFVYFNPQTKQYETVSTKPIPLEIIPFSQQVAKLQQKIYQPQQKIELEDIRYIKTKMKVKNFNNLNIYLFYLGIQTLPLLSWLTVVVIRISKEKRSKEIKKYRAAKALKFVKKQIKNIPTDNRFFQQLYDIVVTYLADKMFVPKEAITIELLNQNLQHKIDKNVYQEFISLWEEINFYKYSPVKAEKIAFKDWIVKTINILEKLEYELQKI